MDLSQPMAPAEYWPTYTPPTTSPLLIIAAFLTPIGAAFGTAVMATVTSRNKERELSRMYAEKGDQLLKLEQWPVCAGQQSPSGMAYEAQCKSLELVTEDIAKLEAKIARRVNFRDAWLAGLRVGALVGFVFMFIATYTAIYLCVRNMSIFSTAYPWSWLSCGFLVGFARGWREKNGKWKI